MGLGVQALGLGLRSPGQKAFSGSCLVGFDVWLLAEEILCYASLFKNWDF